MNYGSRNKVTGDSLPYFTFFQIHQHFVEAFHQTTDHNKLNQQ